jgi:hypothetical protein
MHAPQGTLFPPHLATRSGNDPCMQFTAASRLDFSFLLHLQCSLALATRACRLGWSQQEQIALLTHAKCFWELRWALFCMIPVYEKRMSGLLNLATRGPENETVRENRHRQSPHAKENAELVKRVLFAVIPREARRSAPASGFRSWHPLLQESRGTILFLEDGMRLGEVGVKRVDDLAVFFFDHTALDLQRKSECATVKSKIFGN